MATTDTASAATAATAAAAPATYTITRIPFDASLPLAEHSAPVTPFESDSLKQCVGAYFAREEAEAPAGALARLAAAREAELSASLAQAGMAMPAAALAAAAAAPSRVAVDITLLTVPHAPAFESVSLYGDPSARAKGRPINARAVALCVAAGHPPTTEIRGDVFLGRCIENDAEDVWERRSIGAAEAVPDAPWCRAAGAANAGRDTSTFSSSGLMAKMGGAAGGAAGGGAGRLLEPADRLAWKDSGAPGDATAYKWRRRSPAEIELRIPLPSPTMRARDIDVTLTGTRLGYRVKGSAEAVAGPLGAPGGGKLTGALQVDECDWQVDGGVLLVTLALKDTGAGETSSFAWPRVFESEL